MRYCYRTEPDTASFIGDCVNKGDVCLDVGAHKGVVTHMLTKRVGDKGKVIAFEPQKERIPISYRQNEPKYVISDDKTDDKTD